ncbi:Cysteine dioxygenase [Bulinus truncatus]|nr:Cysteine dioxygenase [Bulinus truncatus]
MIPSMIELELCAGGLHVPAVYLIHTGIILYMFAVLVWDNVYLKRYARLVLGFIHRRFIPTYFPSQGVIEENGIQHLSELIERLENLNWNDESVTSEVRNLLESYTGGQADWEQHCTLGQNSYNRHLIHESAVFQLILLVFKPLKANLPHNHRDSLCWFKVLKGRLIEKQFKRPLSDGPWQWKSIKLIATNEMNDNPDVCYAHCCENPSDTETTISLAVYFPPIGQGRTFKLLTGDAEEAYWNFDSPDYYRQRFPTFYPLYVMAALLLLVVFTPDVTSLAIIDSVIVTLEAYKHLYFRTQRLDSVHIRDYSDSFS